jgi:hypothetical protein
VALCKTALEEACQWAVKSIVFEVYNDAERFPSIPDLQQRIEALEAQEQKLRQSYPAAFATSDPS